MLDGIGSGKSVDDGRHICKVVLWSGDNGGVSKRADVGRRSNSAANIDSQKT